MVASLRNIDKSGKGGQDSIVIDEGDEEGGEDLDDEDDEKSDEGELQSVDVQQHKLHLRIEVGAAP